MTFTALFSRLKISPPFNNVSDSVLPPDDLQSQTQMARFPQNVISESSTSKEELWSSVTVEITVLPSKSPEGKRVWAHAVRKKPSHCRRWIHIHTYYNKGCVYLHLTHWHERSARGPWCKYEASRCILTFSLTRWQISLCKRQRRALTFCGISTYLVRSKVRYELLYVGTSW